MQICYKNFLDAQFKALFYYLGKKKMIFKNFFLNKYVI